MSGEKRTWQRDLKDGGSEALKGKVKQDADVLLKDGGNQTRGIKTQLYFAKDMEGQKP